MPDDLKKRILEEMTVDYSDTLKRNFDLAKQFVRITGDGTVEVLVRDKVTGTERILLYLIGKMYAREAGLATTDEAGNDELMRELGIPIGSLLPWLKELRDKNKIKQVRRGKNVYHTAPINLLESILKSIEKKVKKPEV